MANIDRTLDGRRNHRKGRTLAVLIASVVIITLTSTFLFAALNSESNPPESNVPTRVSYTTHAKISINGNAGFLAVNTSTGISKGSGTPTDPYVIQGWEINAGIAYAAIVIINSNVSFEIIGNHLHDSGTCGIFLDHVSNGLLAYNEVLYNGWDNGPAGIGIGYSSNITLFRNNVSQNVCHNLVDCDGISVTYSNNITLEDNTVISNGISGIAFYGSKDNRVINNTVSSNPRGVVLSSSYSNTISDNTISDNLNGVDLSSSQNNIVLNNTISNNTRGFFIEASSNTIFNNTILNNTAYGVYLHTGSNNRIWNNTLYHNNGSGDIYNQAENQALDSGGINWWNSTTGYGNYWADWTTPDIVYRFGIVDLPYNISGTKHAQDFYPLTSPKVSAPPIPEFSEIVVPIVGLMLIALIVGKTRTKP